jgi:competence/damage-inducible protein CinA-like protein
MLAARYFNSRLRAESMQAEILATGDEIRSGALIDTNSAFIAEVLEQNGLQVTRHQSVGDDMGMLAAVIAEISRRADVAVVTGGLGPTLDDMSAAAAARAAGLELVLDVRALEDIENFFRERNRSMANSNRKQAYLPKGSVTLYNPVGTAPGFQIKIGRCEFFFLPGVPYEMKKILTEQVSPRLQTLQGSQRQYCLIRTLSSFGLPESSVGEMVADLETQFPAVKLGLRAKFPEIQVKLYSRRRNQRAGQADLDAAAQWVARQLGNHLFSANGRSMEAVLGELLRARQATVAVAESCTGGLVANWLTNVAGSSDYFLLSAVTYANAAKVRVLGVSPDTLAQFGAVHEETAREMAVGVRQVAGATYGLATTGIAGPSGGSADKPVGTVCIGIATAERIFSRRLSFFFGKRLMNKRIFAMAALDMLRRALLEEKPNR